MKKLLFVDPICSFGHVNLNRVYVMKLMEAGFSIDLVLKEGYVDDLRFPRSLVRLSLPSHHFTEDYGRFRFRYNQLIILRTLKCAVDLSKYDAIFFSSYEEISFFLSGIRGRLVLVNHANVSG